MSARAGSGLLDPLVEYQLALREQLAGFGRAMAFGLAATWATRGLCLGLLADLLLLLARWLRVPLGPLAPGLALLAALPLALALAAGVLAASRPRRPERIARQVDARLGLAERTLTALGAPRQHDQAGPLHLWQLRDAVEHLQRAEPLAAFPIPLPRHELLAALALALAGMLLWVVPSPFAARGGPLDARGQLVRDEAERLTRAAQSLAEDPALQSQELAQVRELLREAARRVDQEVGNPERAAASLDEIERQLQAMMNADQDLVSALASVASALAASPETQDLGLALQTGDLKDVSRAARDLARQAEGMAPNARARAGRALRSAGQRAGDDPSGVGRRLQQAGDALDPSGADSASALSERDALAQAQTALRELAELSAGAAARQRAQSALEGARNSLRRGQPGSGQQPGGMSGSEFGRGGMPGDQSGQGRSGQDASGQGEGEPGGSTWGTGTLNRRGEATRIDTITRPEQVSSGQQVAPNEVGDAPVLQAPGGNTPSVGEEAVQPQFEAQASTAPGQDASIPLGLRELVKEYFSSQEARR